MLEHPLLNLPINRQAIEDELNIDGGEHVLARFKITGIILNE